MLRRASQGSTDLIDEVPLLTIDDGSLAYSMNEDRELLARSALSSFVT